MRQELAALFVCVLIAIGCSKAKPPPAAALPGLPLADLEESLRPMAKKLGQPKPGDWLSVHQEEGQTFLQYMQLRPKRRRTEKSTIYLLLLGDFSPEQKEVLRITREYLSVFCQTPVVVQQELRLDIIPDHARRLHPEWATKQIHSNYVLDEILRP